MNLFFKICKTFVIFFLPNLFFGFFENSQLRMNEDSAKMVPQNFKAI